MFGEKNSGHLLCRDHSLIYRYGTTRRRGRSLDGEAVLMRMRLRQPRLVGRLKADPNIEKDVVPGRPFLMAQSDAFTREEYVQRIVGLVDTLDDRKVIPSGTGNRDATHRVDHCKAVQHPFSR